MTALNLTLIALRSSRVASSHILLEFNLFEELYCHQILRIVSTMRNLLCFEEHNYKIPP